MIQVDYKITSSDIVQSPYVEGKYYITIDGHVEEYFDYLTAKSRIEQIYRGTA